MIILFQTIGLYDNNFFLNGKFLINLTKEMLINFQGPHSFGGVRTFITPIAFSYTTLIPIW